MIVVIGVVVLLTTGIIAGTSASLSRTSDSQLRSAAVRYAQEGIELSRSIRDDGWNAFAALGQVPSTYCVGDDTAFTATTSTCSTPNINNVYARSVTLTLTTPTSMSVDVVVNWGASSNNKVELKTDLTQWR